MDLLPLRQMVHASGEAATAFARQGLLDWLSGPGRYRIRRHGSGGQIHAASEFALVDAQVVLREAYGPLVSFGTPTVHACDEGGNLMAPIVFVRIDAPKVHGAQLLQLLADRGCCIQEVEQARDRIVVRAEVELTRSIGLARNIEDLSGRDAHVLSWLARYERPPV